MPNQSSFLPEDYLEKRAQRRTNALSVALFAVVMLAVVGAFLVTERQGAEVRARQAQVNARFEDAAKRIEQVDELQARRGQMIQKAVVTGALIEPVPRTLILSELVNNMPERLSLLEFQLDTRVIPPRATATTALDKAKQEAQLRQASLANAVAAEAEVPPTEVSVQVVGVAPTDVQVAQFMTALGRCPLFTDLNLAFSEETVLDEHTMRKFRIEMKVRGDLDLQAVEPARVERLIHNPMGHTVQIDARGQLVAPVEVKPGVKTAHVGE